MGGANPNQAPGPTNPALYEIGDKFNYGSADNDRRKIEMEMEQERQREFDLRRQREYELAKAREAEARSRGQAGAPVSAPPAYTSRPITPPGVSDTPGVPGTGRSPFANRPVRSQQDNRIELERAAQARAQQMAMLERRMADAKEQEMRLREKAERNRSTRGMEGNAALEAEQRLREQQEQEFNRRLQEATRQGQQMSRQPGRRGAAAAQRQAEMVGEFERARGQGKNYDISQFEARFGPQSQAGITAPAPGEEGPMGIVSYQELLDRLKRYQSGGV